MSASQCATSLPMQIPLQDSTQLALCLYPHLAALACQNLHAIFIVTLSSTYFASKVCAFLFSHLQYNKVT